MEVPPPECFGATGPKRKIPHPLRIFNEVRSTDRTVPSSRVSNDEQVFAEASLPEDSLPRNGPTGLAWDWLGSLRSALVASAVGGAAITPSAIRGCAQKDSPQESARNLRARIRKPITTEVELYALVSLLASFKRVWLTLINMVKIPMDLSSESLRNCHQFHEFGGFLLPLVVQLLC